MPFLGHFEHSIDAKGRVSVPAAYRDELARSNADRLIISPFGGENPVLWIFPPHVWEEMVAAKMAEATSPFDPKIVEFKRGIIQRSVGANLDSNGRILVPSELRAFANLERDVVLAGMNDYFEIWDAERYRVLNGGPIPNPKLWESI